VAILTQRFAQKPAKAEAVFNQQDSHLIPSPQTPRALCAATSPAFVLEAPKFVGCSCPVFLEKYQTTRHPTAPPIKKMTLNQFYELTRMLITNFLQIK
jgi:hypothetical protein